MSWIYEDGEVRIEADEALGKRYEEWAVDFANSQVHYYLDEVAEAEFQHNAKLLANPDLRHQELQRIVEREVYYRDLLEQVLNGLDPLVEGLQAASNQHESVDAGWALEELLNALRVEVNGRKGMLDTPARGDDPMMIFPAEKAAKDDKTLPF